MRPTAERSTLLAAATLGVGFGGLLDVILFHQILRTHHLVSGYVDPTTLSGLRTNVFADGVFSLAMLLVVCVGGVKLWSALVAADPERPPAASAVGGAAVVGLGAWNLFDVVVDHALLGLHHATYPVLDAYDLGWLVASLALVAAGWIAVEKATPTAARADADAD
ncbi:DUF2243 domain-containing protein [Candidatus Halobonum tyrrellensis]|uniref:DUF2243 domain-containing protein n=1 Tax=Candidatus Halobonum tyrrellensis TaxID=1431545 RepID=UPI00067768C8|nr:DUF2243 domain-containing protein [Candidatus Halobonum tyrrellensis]